MSTLENRCRPKIESKTPRRDHVLPEMYQIRFSPNPDAKRPQVEVFDMDKMENFELSGIFSKENLNFGLRSCGCEGRLGFRLTH
jgi:hypothetical protein